MGDVVLAWPKLVSNSDDAAAHSLRLKNASGSLKRTIISMDSGAHYVLHVLISILFGADSVLSRMANGKCDYGFDCCPTTFLFKIHIT